MQITAQDGIMATLKVATQPLHDAVESNAFQEAFGKGLLSREDYIRWLGQMYEVHQALEDALPSLREQDRRVGGIVTPDQFKCSRLRDDLAFFGCSVDEILPVPATIEAGAYIAELAQHHPLALLGFHYVLEGSTNGNRFAARGLRSTFGLEDKGVSYLDPYGKEQRKKWGQFKSDMDAADFAESEVEIIKEAACRAFELIGGIGTGLADIMGEPANSS